MASGLVVGAGLTPCASAALGASSCRETNLELHVTAFTLSCQARLFLEHALL